MRLGDFIGHDLFSCVLCLVFRIWDFVPMSALGGAVPKQQADMARRWEGGHGEAFDMLDLVSGRFSLVQQD